jgi:hypothetical protein
MTLRIFRLVNWIGAFNLESYFGIFPTLTADYTTRSRRHDGQMAYARITPKYAPRASGDRVLRL